MLRAPRAAQTTPRSLLSGSCSLSYLQLADPLLQCPGAFRDGALLCQGGFKALDDPVRLLDLLLQAQSGLGSAVGKRGLVSSVARAPTPCRRPPPKHSLVPIEVAQAMHIVVFVLDTVEDHRQLQGH